MSVKWWLRSCPRCGGDLYGDAYSEDYEAVCLQCGAVLNRQALLDGSPASSCAERSRLSAPARASEEATRAEVGSCSFA